jgi:ATP-dependent Zn protease
MTAHEKKLVATHEAAHAVVANFFHHKIKKADLTGIQIEIKSSDGVAPTGQTAHEVIITSLAGGIASRRFSGDGVNGDGDDKAYVKYLALRLSEGRENEAAALLDWCRHRATTAVNQNWRQIEAVAAALLDREKLSGAEINEILVRECRDMSHCD